MFPKEFSGKILKFFQIVGIACFLFIAFTHVRTFSQYMLLFELLLFLMLIWVITSIIIAFIRKSIYHNKIVFRSSSISGPFEKFDKHVVQTDWNRYKQHVNCTFEGPGHASVVQVINQMHNTQELFWSWNALILHVSRLF